MIMVTGNLARCTVACIAISFRESIPDGGSSATKRRCALCRDANNTSRECLNWSSPGLNLISRCSNPKDECIWKLQKSTAHCRPLDRRFVVV